MKYPINLKGDCVNQIDQLLTVIGSRELIAVSLSTKTTSGHVSTQLVLDALIQIADVSANWVQFSLVGEQSLSTGLYVIRVICCHISTLSLIGTDFGSKCGGCCSISTSYFPNRRILSLI